MLELIPNSLSNVSLHFFRFFRMLNNNCLNLKVLDDFIWSKNSRRWITLTSVKSLHVNWRKLATFSPNYFHDQIFAKDFDHPPSIFFHWFGFLRKQFIRSASLKIRRKRRIWKFTKSCKWRKPFFKLDNLLLKHKLVYNDSIPLNLQSFEKSHHLR
jgi:hypothetical protein